MYTLKMNAHEVSALKSVLSEALDEVRGEIVRTEDWELKDALKERRLTLERLAEELEKMSRLETTS